MHFNKIVLSRKMVELMHFITLEAFSEETTWQVRDVLHKKFQELQE